LFSHLRSSASPEKRRFSVPTTLSVAVHLLILCSAVSTVSVPSLQSRAETIGAEVRFFVPRVAATPAMPSIIETATASQREPSPNNLSTPAKRKPQKAPLEIPLHDDSDDMVFQSSMQTAPDIVTPTELKESAPPATANAPRPAIEEVRRSVVQSPLAPNAPWQCQWNIDYSAEAREAGIEGTVLFQCMLDRDGLLKHCAVVKGPAPLSQIVLAHIEKARCKAGERTMARAPMRISQEVRFVLERSAPSPEFDGVGSSRDQYEVVID
jgi:outer membrane biosynthesis protein TonB